MKSMSLFDSTPDHTPSYTLCIRLLVLVSLITSPCTRADEVIDPVALINQMEELYRGDSSRSEMTMHIKTPNYGRTMNMTTVSKGDEKSFIRILNPRKDRGIATLRVDQDMWNYFPKINKVIKVPPSMMTSGWMGSDFTNDDLVRQTKLTDEYDLAVTESDGHYTITLTPKAQTVTVWGRIEYVVTRQPLLPVSQSFYDERGDKIRQMTFSDVRDFEGRTLPGTVIMETLNKPGHRTVISYDALTFDDDIGDDEFTLRQLKRRF